MQVPQRAAPDQRAQPTATRTDSALAADEPDNTPSQAASATGDRPWRRSLRAAGSLWLITHCAYVVMTFFAFFQSRERLPRNLGSAFARWGNWDAQWFFWIAEHGYTGYHGKDIDEERSAAFFPLYSVLIKGLSYIVVEPIAAALIIAFAAQIAAFTVLHRFTEEELGEETGHRTLWYMVAFPTGFYLGMMYNASLFLLLIIGSMYLMRRGTWWGAAALGGLATATRSAAILLFIPFCYEYLRQHRFRIRDIRGDAAWIALIPTGIMSYSVFCYYTFGDALKFTHAQALWEREQHPPWVGIIETIKTIASTDNILGNDVRNLMDLGCVLFVMTMLVLGFVGPWRFRRDQLFLPIYGVASVLFIISFPSFDQINRVPLLSAGRLCLECFPAFMVAARIGRRAGFDRTFVFIGLMLQGLWFSHFLLHHFIG